MKYANKYKTMINIFRSSTIYLFILIATKIVTEDSGIVYTLLHCIC